MTRIFITFIFIAWFATADVFAQRNRAQPAPQQQAGSSATLVEVDDIAIVRLPQRNDEAGIIARDVLEAAQRIINPPIPEFGFMQPTDDERKAWFQQALDTLRTLLVFVNPPEETAEVPVVYGEEQPPAFVPDAFVNAHYLLGTGWIYFNMMNRQDLFSLGEIADFPQKVAEYFEAFIQNGVAENSAFIHAILSNLYTRYLNDPRKALINIDRAIVLEPRYPFHHISRAMFLQGQGYPEQACASLRRARDLGEREASALLMQEWGC